MQPADQLVENRAGGLRLDIGSGADGLQSGEVLYHGAIIAVHHQSEKLAGLAEPEVAALRRKVAERAVEKPVVALEESGLGCIEFEPNLAVAAPAAIDQDGFG